MSTCTIHSYELGPMENYIYLIHDHASNRAAVVDPAWDIPSVVTAAKSLGATISDVFITHSHDDHINGLDALRQHYPLNVHISHEEADFWQSTPADAIRHEDGEKIQLGDTQVTWMLTPGHTPGSACLYVDEKLIAGDTLFIFGCGRCDLQGGDPKQMYQSLQSLKTRIPENTIVLPGHNYSDRPSSTMDVQLQGNPFLHWDTEEGFIRYRMDVHDKIRDTPYGPVTREELAQVM